MENRTVAHSFQTGSYNLSVIADTSERFSDFAPYVASINNNGFVAFQAGLKGGGSGVYSSDGATITTVVDSVSGPFCEICSHPDINRDESICFYAESSAACRGVFVVHRREISTVATDAGPLGPTMNEAGAIAFRAKTKSGGDGIFTARDGNMATIAETNHRFIEFHGIPVINKTGDVAFRADLKSGGQGIYVGDGERVTIIAETGYMFSGFGSFPILNDAGDVAFCATLQDNRSGIFMATGGRIETILDSSGPFESFRGVLVNNASRMVFYATPRGGSLGVFTGPDPSADCLLALNSPLCGSTVADFALNPVSINDRGQLAIRVMLADRRQFILRADPRQINEKRPSVNTNTH